MSRDYIATTRGMPPTMTDSTGHLTSGHSIMRERPRLLPSLALVLVIVMLGAGTALLHRWQFRRHAADILDIARNAESKGRSDRAGWLTKYYLDLVPTDTAAWARYGLTLEDAARNAKSRHAVAEIYDRVLNENPNLDNARNIRTRLVKLYVQDGRFSDATGHLRILGADKDNVADAELVYLLALCSQANAETVEKAKEYYRRSLTLDSSHVNRHFQLAMLLYPKRIELTDTDWNKSVEVADERISTMVQSNPKNAAAYLARVRYRNIAYEVNKSRKIRRGQMADDLSKQQAIKEKRDIDAANDKDIQTALQLAPDDVEVRLIAANTAAASKDAAAARKHLQVALERKPSDERIYLALSAVEIMDGKRTEAVAQLRSGIARLPGRPLLLFVLAEVLIEMNSIPEADRALGEIERWKLSPERALILRGRLRMAEGNWKAARDMLEEGRPSLTTKDASLATEADMLLGQCYIQLGDFGPALAAYSRADGDGNKPTNATANVAMLLLRLGRTEQAIAKYQRFVDSPEETYNTRHMYVRLKTIQWLNQPVNTRRYESIESVLKKAREKYGDEMDFILLDAEARAANGKNAEAEQLLRTAFEKNKTPEIGLSLAKLLARDKKVPEALSTIQSLEPSGPTVNTVLARLEVIPDGTDARATQAIQVAETLFHQSAPNDKLTIATGLAETQTRWNNLQDARRWWLEVIRLRPFDITVYFSLFNIAVKADDRAQMEECVRDIHRIEGKPGPFGHYAEALLRFSRVKDHSAEAFEQARHHLSTAIQLRPDNWPYPYSHRALLSELEKKPDEAIEDYLRAIDRGERRTEILQRAVFLLNAKNQNQKANELLELLQTENFISTDLNKLAAEVYLKNLDMDQAAKSAMAAVSKESKSYEDLLWKAQLLERASNKTEAENAYRQAVTQAGTRGVPWVALVQFHMNCSRDPKASSQDRSSHLTKAKAVIEELRRMFSGPELPVTLAQCLEVAGQFTEAEAAYKAYLDANSSSLNAIREWISFQRRSGSLAKVIPDLQRALAMNIPPADALDFRRTLAMALTMKGDYPSYLEALSLSDQIIQTDPKDMTNVVFKAQVLASRLSHHREALQLLLQIQKQHKLESGEEFLLGELLVEAGAWDEGQRILTNLLSREPGNQNYLRFYLDHLLRNNKVGEAEFWLVQLEKFAPDDIITARLKTIYLAKKNDLAKKKSYAEAAAFLRTFGLANPSASTNPSPVASERIRFAAQLADELSREFHDTALSLASIAELLYEKAAKEGTVFDRLALASFIGRHGKIKDALAIAKEVAKSAEPKTVTAVSMNIASVLLSIAFSSESMTDADLDLLEAELNISIQRSENVPGKIMSLGMMHVRRGRLQEAAKAFREIVEANDKDAMALNNLAYMLILTGTNYEEVNAILKKAESLVGPTAGLLDTRGMAHLAAGRTKEAIADMTWALEQEPSAVKFLHLAMAYQKAGQTKEARVNLDKAIRRKYEDGLTIPTEQDHLKKLDRELTGRN